jgi:hypothetical protein
VNLLFLSAGMLSMKGRDGMLYESLAHDEESWAMVSTLSSQKLLEAGRRKAEEKAAAAKTELM